MGSPTENSDQTFPPADVAAELNPGNNTNVQVDPISSEVAAAREMKVHTSSILLVYINNKQRSISSVMSCFNNS